MKSITVSCPGKVILFGEHSVVYNRLAIVSSLSRRTTCKISESEKQTSLYLPLFEKTYTIPTEILFQSLYEIEQNEDYSEPLIKVLLVILQSVVSKKEFTNLKIEINSTIPIGSGLGSSASFCVSLAASLLIFFKKIDPINNKFTQEQLEKINTIAYKGENIFHGSSSGIDNTISTFGGIFTYQKGKIKPISFLKKNIEILIINSGIQRKTKEKVGRVRELYDQYQDIMTHIFNAMEQITVQFISEFTTKQTNTETNPLDKANQLCRIFHELLCSIDVSHPKLDPIIKIGQKFGMHLKITGAGGGGCVYGFLLPNVDYSELEQELKNANLQYFRSKLGGEGVKIL
ncbi:mevalonate kinase [Anaeramoeba flamelloides]|uniref:Mevalonate kinase n=1 Tax=Anaeramoeba flamelloides TaxID=1746091 RepID=A0AAV7YUU4_9EUKA|nr:mevalonate kinase [Anaeramoeba flamelloides]